jgi:CheY-like chemotaxis protein
MIASKEALVSHPITLSREALNDELAFDVEDELVFADEEPPEVRAAPWRVLMVDDDEQVHAATALALGDGMVLGRPLCFWHARSAREAIELMESGAEAPDAAFVDMVMETSDAGLRFARAAKGSPSWGSMKILLRSGQPGFADEMERAKDLGVEGFADKASTGRAGLLEALEQLLSGNLRF